MNICLNCRQEMDVAKTGICISYGKGHCYSADRLRCRACGLEVAVCARQPYYDPTYKLQGREIVEMNKEQTA